MKTLYNLHTLLLLILKIVVTFATALYITMELKWLAPSVITAPLWLTLLFGAILVFIMHYKEFLKTSIFESAKQAIVWSIILEALLLITVVIRVELLWEILSDRKIHMITTLIYMSGVILAIYFLPQMIKSRREFSAKKDWHQYTTGKSKN